MHTGAITQYIDVAQIALYAFWIFFAGLIYYLRQEDKREGYPLESDISDRVRSQGFPPMPSPKTFVLAHGGTVSVPNGKRDGREIRATPTARSPGSPLEPTGDPMLDGVGPASYANRADTPDLTLEGQPKIVPLRIAPDFVVESRDPDPRGMEVFGADKLVGGIVRDIWVDRSEVVFRYLEVEVTAGGSGKRVLLPLNFTRIDSARRHVKVKAILARQFANVPVLKNAEQVTFLEEDRITAYYAGGKLYAEPSRMGPLI